MKARLIVGILIVGLIVAAVTITWNRGGGSDGATVTQVAHREPLLAEPPPPEPPPVVHGEPPRATSNGHLQANANSDAQPATIAATESAESNSTALKTDDTASKPDDVTQAPASDGATQKNDVASASMPTTLTPSSRPVVSIASSEFEPECQQIREAIKTDTTTPRGDLLSMYARTSEGSGEFRAAAAACALFLDEVGNNHPLAVPVAIRMGDCLAPMDLNNLEITESENGPQFRPRWRTEEKPSVEQLYQAIAAYERAIEISSDENQQAQAQVKIGWVYRALNDLEASTEILDQCAEHASHLRIGQEALYYAAENLALTGREQAAAERYLRLAAIDPDKPWAKAAKRKAERLMSIKQEGAK